MVPLAEQNKQGGDLSAPERGTHRQCLSQPAQRSSVSPPFHDPPLNPGSRHLYYFPESKCHSANKSQTPRNTPTHGLHKAPCCTEGLSFGSKSWNISFATIFSKLNIRVDSLSVTNKNLSDTSQQLPSILTYKSQSMGIS